MVEQEINIQHMVEQEINIQQMVEQEINTQGIQQMVEQAMDIQPIQIITVDQLLTIVTIGANRRKGSVLAFKLGHFQTVKGLYAKDLDTSSLRIGNCGVEIMINVGYPAVVVLFIKALSLTQFLFLTFLVSHN